MITLAPPSADRLSSLVERQRPDPFNYQPGLLGRIDGLRRWYVDRHDEVVGHGEHDFAAACDAVRDWAMFRQTWARPAVPLAPIEPGATVGYTARASGLWWSYCCRIIAVIDETDADGTRRFGFDYGTLRGHAERGEERFLVTRTPTGDVHFSLLAISRPGRWWVWMGLPLARRAQARFRPDATAAVRDAVTALRTGSTDPGTSRRSPGA
ncbi:MAG: DUF1990 domain-containing protein [Actinobacteria bacterium]|nr:DUF1990 domain-containing protein [Actinomycetota bacterium]